MMGGGSKVQKPLFTSYQNRGPKVIIAKRPGSTSHNDYGKVTVGFSSDFDDTFGTQLSHVYATVLNDTDLMISAQAIDSFSINTSETSLEFRILNVQRMTNYEYDLSNVSTVKSLVDSSTLIDAVQYIETIDTPTDLSIVNNVNSPNAVQNKSPQFRDFGSTYRRFFQIENLLLSTYANRDANGSIRRTTFNRPLQSNIYGPVTYDVITFVKDRNNDSANQFDTTSIMRRYVDIEGLDNVQLNLVGGASFANSSDTLTITWRFANTSESISNFNNVRVCKNNIDQTEITGLNFSAITKNGSNYSLTVTGLSAIESIGYRGEIKAYVQWKHVSWSPLNMSSALVFSYSSAPLSNFIVYISNSKSVERTLLDTQLYFKLQNNINYNDYFATNRPHTVTFYFHDNASRSADTIVGSVLYTGLTNTNINSFNRYIISDLIPNTEYFVSYTVDDGRNPTYTGTIVNPDPSSNGGYKTRLDDKIPPTISNFSLIPMESSIRVRATIADETALNDARIIVITGNQTNRTNAELQNYFDTANNVVTVDASGLTTKIIDTNISQQYRPAGAALVTETEYTVVLRVSDRGSNTVFAKATANTSPDIKIRNVLFEPEYQRYDVTADVEFSDIPNINIDYYIGVFNANVDSNNEAAVINLLTSATLAPHFLVRQNFDASPSVRVQGSLSSVFNVTNGERSTIQNFDYYNLVIFAKGTAYDYSFITTLYQTFLQYRSDESPPIITNINVDFNVRMD